MVQGKINIHINISSHFPKPHKLSRLFYFVPDFNRKVHLDKKTAFTNVFTVSFSSTSSEFRIKRIPI